MRQKLILLIILQMAILTSFDCAFTEITIKMN